jgi:hypothetical protein
LNGVLIVDFLIGFLLMSFLFLFHIGCSIFGAFAISGLRSSVSREGCRKAEDYRKAEDCRKAENYRKAENNITSVHDEGIFG